MGFGIDHLILISMTSHVVVVSVKFQIRVICKCCLYYLVNIDHFDTRTKYYIRTKSLDMLVINKDIKRFDTDIILRHQSK